MRTRRGNKHVQFVALNDGSTIRSVQIVFDMTLFSDDDLRPVTTGSAIHVKGLLVESQGRGQSCEVQARTLEVFGTADPATYPLQKKGHSLEFLREIAHLRPRTNTFGAVLRIRSALAFAIHKFFQERGFYYLNTPLITASDCEGAGAMFQVTTLDIAKSAARRRGTTSTTAPTSSASRRLSPSAASSKASSEPRLWARSIRSAPPSAPKTPTLRAICRSSG